MASVVPSVGHDLFDAHHRGIQARMEGLRQRFEARDAGGVAVALDALCDEVMVHFASEDALMEAHAYPERTAHRASHHLFQADLEAIRREVHAQGLGDRVEDWILRRGPEWFRFHVETNDAPLAVHLARRTAAGIVAAALHGTGGPHES